MSDALIPDPTLADPVRPAVSHTPWLTAHLEHRFQSNGAGFHLHLAFSAYAQRTVVFGPSGSGKSSLLRAIAGLLKPDVATIEFHGTTVCNTTAGGKRPNTFVPAEKRRVGLVMQSPSVFPHLTAAGNVAFALRGKDRATQKEKIAQLLQLVEAQSLANRWPRELSGGQLQRIAIARTLAAEPTILLLDEPFAALDALSRQRISTNLHQWARERGVPVMTVTHNLEEVFASGDEVLIMEEGRVLAQGTPERVLAIQRERLLQVLHAVPAPLPEKIYPSPDNDG
ncbi:MAG: ATP-binding cassette domain-containing protein [Acidobacteriota bacterium]